MAAVGPECYKEAMDRNAARAHIGQLIDIVQQNCHISDARHAGNYSMCTFLMKMREFYRWEQALGFDAPLGKDEVGDWLVQREQDWQDIEDQDYAALPLKQGEIDPFEADVINSELLPQGYVYSSGYGIFCKPHFFIGKLHQQMEREGVRVLVSANEYARDLVAPPAMSCNGTVFIRMESLRRFLWEKLEEWRWQKNTNLAMGRALAAYGGTDDTQTLLDRMTENEIETMVRHEIGEVRAGRELGPEWETMLAGLDSRRAEMAARALRDNLADCLGTLPALAATRNTAALHFWFANYTGLRKLILPALRQAYDTWTEDSNWQRFEAAVSAAADACLESAHSVLTLYRDRGASAGTSIAEHLAPDVS